MQILHKQLHIDSKHYLQILACLKEVQNSQARLIGGSVRDALLGKKNPDIDIATTLLPQQTMDVLKANNVHIVPTGIKFGTVTAFVEDEKFEITTLRKDLDPTGRHTNVEYTTDFAIDASRRDFTINALSYCPFKHAIYDYTGGIKDLQESRLIFIGDPIERIKEDYLRILRFFRFSCNYSKNVDQKGLEACILLKDGLKILSKERIKDEMDKLLILRASPEILEVMHDNNVLSEIFPIEYFVKTPLANAINYAEKLGTYLSKLARYGILFYPSETMTVNKMMSMRFSRSEAHEVISVISFLKGFLNSNSNFILKKLWYEQKLKYLEYISVALGFGTLNYNDVIAFLDKYRDKEHIEFPVNGNDLKEFGFRAKEIGDSLERLKAAWIDSDFTLSRLELIKLLK